VFITTLLTTLFLLAAIMTWQVAKVSTSESSETNMQYLVFHLLSVGAVAGLLLNVLLLWITSGSKLFG